MTAWTTVYGRVVDPDGKPVAGVPVQMRGLAPRGGEVTSAADGTFKFDKLAPGSFRLIARPKLPATSGPDRMELVSC